MQIVNKKGLKVALYGGEEGDASGAKIEILKNFKNLEVLALTPPRYDKNATPVDSDERKKEKAKA